MNQSVPLFLPPQELPVRLHSESLDVLAAIVALAAGADF
jgi:hypothetical protein